MVFLQEGGEQDVVENICQGSMLMFKINLLLACKALPQQKLGYFKHCDHCVEFKNTKTQCFFSVFFQRDSTIQSSN